MSIRTSLVAVKNNLKDFNIFAVHYETKLLNRNLTTVKYRDYKVLQWSLQQFFKIVTLMFFLQKRKIHEKICGPSFEKKVFCLQRCYSRELPIPFFLFFIFLCSNKCLNWRCSKRQEMTWNAPLWSIFFVLPDWFSLRKTRWLVFWWCVCDVDHFCFVHSCFTTVV